MRKIEAQMNAAVTNRVCWKSGNTQVIYSAIRGASEVFLHNNLIATVALTGEVQIRDGGWQSTTTKSRLNALLSSTVPNTRVFAKAFEWFVSTSGETTEFESGMILS